MKPISNKKIGIVYTFIMAVLLIATIFAIIKYMYDHTKSEAFERLRLETAKQKKAISLQVTSDRETLSSMASLISANYHDNSGYLEVCKNFEPFGLCRNIGILVPGDILITKHGFTDVKGKISFEDERQKGTYISGRVQDVTNDQKNNMRSVVPIIGKNGNVNAILFGVISVEDFSNYYKRQSSMVYSYLSILDGDTGEFIIDTKNVLEQKTLVNLSDIKYNSGYNYDDFSRNITKGTQGYVSFVANDSDEFLYVCYDVVGIENWRIMLAQPESTIMASAHKTVSYLAFSSVIICLIVLIYVLGIAFSNRKKSHMNYVASEIRKSLLEINHRSESLVDALRTLTGYARSRSAFVSDSYEEECHYIVPEKAKDKLKSDEIQYFNSKLLLYTSRTKKSQGANVYSNIINLDSRLKKDMPDFYDFMVNHKISRIVYNVVINDNSTMYVLGVLNPKNEFVSQLLNKISICFSMAVYNRKHLERTRYMALTDSLTGVKNRMSFTQDVRGKNYNHIDCTCIYIDVNELNYYNNKYGHAAGDQMLKYIADTLKSEFSDSNVYRMGGDEFLILSPVISEEEISSRLVRVNAEVEEMKYHIASGVKFCIKGSSLEDAVNEAEKNMYHNKAMYYQDKELHKVTNIKDKNVRLIKTGVKELDACLSVMSIRYYGIYFVSLQKDTCVRILAPSYFSDFDDSALPFSSIIKRYISEFVKPEYHRTFFNFLEYDVLKKHFAEQHIPEMSYERIDGEKITLRIYSVDSEYADSIWVFERSDR